MALNKKMATLTLVVIVLLGGWLRLQGLNWDQGYHLQPDERYISMVLSSLSPPKNLTEYLDPNKSSLSPYIHNFGAYIYGQLPLTVMIYLSRWVEMEGYDRTYLLGRGISAMLDTLSIILVYKLGKRLWNEMMGIVGAAFYAFSPLAIQYSHFMTMESWLVFSWLIMILILTRLPHQPFAKGWFVMTGLIGVGLGAAMAVKLNSVALVPLVAATILLSFKDSPWRTPRRILLGYFGSLGILGGVTVLSFRFFQPTIFASVSWLDWSLRQDFYQAFNFQRQAIDGKVMFPPQWQWVNTPRWWFPLKNIVLWGMGSAAGGLAVVGIIWQIWRIRHIGGQDVLKKAWRLLLAAWITGVFLWQGGKFVRIMRYYLPFFPLYALFAASAVDSFKRFNLAKARLNLRIIVMAASIISSGLWALMFTNIYRTTTTRIAASEWIYQNIPDGSKVMLEEWDDPLPLSLAGYPAKKYVSAMEPVYAPDDEKKKLLIDGWINKYDWIILSSRRAKGSIGRLPNQFPLMSRFYKDLESGTLGFVKVTEFTSFPKFQFSIDDSYAEESFWVYDHPKVEIYQKLEE
ncbi:glycosyltransferase family 39 protein [Candidatus Collierbacteria bacterium]|nr:glycosyltransferase family 39 protein [Candidatus Collierbacteria bacterium]